MNELIPFEHVNSYGRRGFPVTKHHSIYFGVVFKNNKPSYNWNRNSIDMSERKSHSSEKRIFLHFQQVIEKNIFIFE
ncbi:MAG: hypothetical protein ACFFB0_16395 [Promethearchaeota archaeon]